MKGTEKIIAHIQADAKAQADAILAQTELQCAEICQSYEAKAKERYGEKIRQGVKVCQDNIDSVERLNQMEARKALLALKQDMVSESFDLAEQLLVEDGSASMLVIVGEDQLGEFRLPVQVKADFVVHGASAGECASRIRQLLWPGSEGSSSDYLAVDNLTINLATYQVKVGGEPLDLTYLEYALLAFLVTHPGRTYSRDALLRRVWGFDYYGGSRTVDVHVRRVRAKLGPDLAQHLETVRGVGYLWSA